LVDTVMNVGNSISKTAKKLRIKITTARLIIRKYKNNGTFPMKRFKNWTKTMPKIKENAELPP